MAPFLGFSVSACGRPLVPWLALRRFPQALGWAWGWPVCGAGRSAVPSRCSWGLAVMPTKGLGEQVVGTQLEACLALVQCGREPPLFTVTRLPASRWLTPVSSVLPPCPGHLPDGQSQGPSFQRPPSLPVWRCHVGLSWGPCSHGFPTPVCHPGSVPSWGTASLPSSGTEPSWRLLDSCGLGNSPGPDHSPLGPDIWPHTCVPAIALRPSLPGHRGLCGDPAPLWPACVLRRWVLGWLPLLPGQGSCWQLWTLLSPHQPTTGGTHVCTNEDGGTPAP